MCRVGWFVMSYGCTSVVSRLYPIIINFGINSLTLTDQPYKQIIHSLLACMLIIVQCSPNVTGPAKTGHVGT